jgi:hypothetical protein
MKKYIKPSVEVVEMEISSVMLETSIRVYDSSTTQDKVLESRRRDARSEY